MKEVLRFWLRRGVSGLRIDTIPNLFEYQSPDGTYPSEPLVVSWEDTQDPQAYNTNSTVYHQYSRDPARTPFPWDRSANACANAGFTTGPPWIPAGSDTHPMRVSGSRSQQHATCTVRTFTYEIKALSILMILKEDFFRRIIGSVFFALVHGNGTINEANIICINLWPDRY
ncbi:hypothetical protein HA402_014699 [Bradysia odoriphaga]|nr:hypothetical protein HA402_014699 [Bradysia odoriphaga]